jgi:hypothetical protein
MSNYIKTTDFAAKDTLPGGDTNKVVRGSEFETEFDAISTAIATKSDTAGPTFTGTVTIPTVDINAGAIDGTTIGANSAAAGTFTNLTATTADINGGTVDGATIGGSSAGAGTFTNLTASGTVNFAGATISNLGTITTANLDGGTADNIVIGGATPAAGTFTSVTTTTADINGGTADNVVIGGSTAAAGTFTTLAASSATVGGSAVLTSVAFSDLQAGAVTLSSETFSDVDNQVPTNAAVIDYVAATIPLISEINDLSANVTWANVPDANITQSSVTQHQAALSIAASQLSDVTSTASELNLIDGSLAGTIVNSKAVIYGAAGEVNATTLQIAGTPITATAAELNILDGVTATTAELNYVDGVTSNIQTQLDSKGTVSTLADLSITATAAELNILDGVTATTAELNYVDGVTSNIQTQIDSISPKLTGEFTANGAIASGDSVIIESAGTVTKIVEAINAGSAPIGSATVAETFNTEFVSLDVDPFNSNRWIAVYADDDSAVSGSNKDMIAKVFTRSGTTITQSSSISIATGGTPNRNCSVAFDKGQENVVLFMYNDNTSDGVVQVGTISGSAGSESISLGTAVDFHTVAAIADDQRGGINLICLDTSGNFMGVWDNFSSNIDAMIFTVSGTSVSVGSETSVATNSAGRAHGYEIRPHASDTTKVFLVYNTTSSNYLTFKLLTRSGTSISVSSASVSTTSTQDRGVTMSVISDTKIIVHAATSLGYPYYQVVTYDGSSSFSFGTATVIDSNNATVLSAHNNTNNNSLFYPYYYVRTPSTRRSYVRTIQSNADASTITVGSETQLDASLVPLTAYIGVMPQEDTDNHYLIVTEMGASDLYYILGNAGSQGTNVTASNFLGFADETISDTATGTVVLRGAITDKLSSLTPGTLYYIQADGTLGTTAANPSVVAGMALSSTELLISGV